MVHEMATGNSEPNKGRVENLIPYQFKPGESGNPNGRPKKKPLTELYERLLDEPEFLADVEEAIRKMVKSGRMVGQLQLKEMTDRLEGKITQPIEADVTVNLAEAIAEARKRAAR